jgi:hypothetical protein
MTTTDTATATLTRRAVFDAESDSPKKGIWNRILGLLNEPTDPYDAVWDALFARSEHVLVAMAEEARQERQAGRTQLLDPDAL